MYVFANSTSDDQVAMWTIIASVGSFFCGLFADAFRQWLMSLLFAPKLLISFHQNQPGFVLNTAMWSSPSRTQDLLGPTGPPGSQPRESKTCYVRIRIVNSGNRIAKNCKAYLVGYHKAAQQSQSSVGQYADTIPRAIAR